MGDSDQQTVTRLLHELSAGNRHAFAELLPLVYDELHQLAAQQRQRWRGDETLNTTALVHEAYLRLVDQTAPQWQSRPHFLAVASKAMRQILLDYAKRTRAAKRGGGAPRVPLHEVETELHTLNAYSDAPGATPLLPAMIEATCVPWPPAHGGAIADGPQSIGSGSGASAPPGQASPTKSKPPITFEVGNRPLSVVDSGSPTTVPYAAQYAACVPAPPNRACV